MAEIPSDAGARVSDRDVCFELLQFLAEQRRRLQAKELDAATIAGEGDGEPMDRALWTTVARALLNLDEAITKG